MDDLAITETPAASREPPLLSDAELAQLAIDIATGRVFHHQSLKNDPDLIRSVFMPIGLGGLSCDPDSVGLIYEYIEKCGPRSINGYPSFFSCRFLHASQLADLVGRVERTNAAIKAAAGGPSNADAGDAK